MLILGIILLILGWLLSLHFLWIIGIILVVVGLILLCLGAAGRPVGGRRYWY